MKTNKPLLVKLSASLLVACGVMLPSLESSAEWSQDGDSNWILTGGSTRTDAVMVDSDRFVTFAGGSSWSKFIPGSYSAAIIYTGGGGALFLNGGSLTVNNPETGPNAIWGVRSDLNNGALNIATWSSSSTVTVNNKYGDAIGIGTDNDDLLIGAPVISGPGTGGTVVPMADVMKGTVNVTGSGDVTGLYSGYDLTVLGNLKGKLAATNNGLEGDAYGLQAASGDLVIQGNLSGQVGASASGDEALALYANYYLTINGDLKGTVTATGNTYASGLYASEEDVYLNNLSGTITVKATGDEGDADGIYANGNIKIGNDFSGKITATAVNCASGMWADGSIYVDGNVSGSITATAPYDGYAYGLYASGRIDIDGDFSGKIVAKAGDVYGAIYSANSDVSMNDFTGSITVTGDCDGVGIYAANAMRINNFSGSIVVNHTSLPGDELAAYGLEAAGEDLEIDGNFTGALTINGNYYAYGLYASENISIGGNLGGKITVTDDSDSEYGAAYGLHATSIYIDGDVSSTVTATSIDRIAYGLHAANRLDIDGDFTGKITVTGGDYAAGMYADGDDVSINDFTGSITVKSISNDADGIYADEDIRINNFSGKIIVNAPDYAGGMWADENDIEIDGNFTGSVTVTGGYEAAGLYGNNYLTIGGDLSGKVTVTATGYDNGAEATGLQAGDEDLTIGGVLSGTITANASMDQRIIVGPILASPAPEGLEPFNASVYATGLDSCEYIYINNGLTGKITATASNTMRAVVDRNSTSAFQLESYAEATGLYAEMDILIKNNGGLTGSIVASAVAAVTNASGVGASATGDAEAEAYGIYAEGSVMIMNGDLAGTISATATASVERTLLDGRTSTWAEAVHADDSIFISGNLSGKVTATGSIATGLFAGVLNEPSFFITAPPAAPDAMPLPEESYSSNQLTILNDLSGKVTVNGGRFAIGLFAADDLIIGGRLSGTVTVTATDDRAYGLGAIDNLVIGVPPRAAPGPDIIPARAPDVLTGTIKVTASNDAYGLFAGTPTEELSIIADDNGWWDEEDGNIDPEGDLSIFGNVTGSVTVTANDAAYGLYANDSISIYGNLAGKVTTNGMYSIGLNARDVNIYGDLSGTVTAIGEYRASGLYAYDRIEIGGDLSGTVLATIANNPEGYSSGLFSDGDLYIHGNLSGKVTATTTAGAWSAYSTGLYADNELRIDGGLSGTVTATATGSNLLELGADATGEYSLECGARAYGLDANDSNVLIGGSLTGKVTATATAKAITLVNSRAVPNVLVHSMADACAIGLTSDNDTAVIGNSDLRGDLSGTITATATATATEHAEARSYGLDASDELYIGGDMSGTITVTSNAKTVGPEGSSGATAIGLEGGSVEMMGNLSGKITATGSTINLSGIPSEVSAIGIESDNQVFIGGDLSGTITAACNGYAVGISANEDIIVAGNLSGKIAATGDYEAVGLSARNALIIGRDFTGTVTAKGGGLFPEGDVYGMLAHSRIEIGSMFENNGVVVLGGNFAGQVSVAAEGIGMGLSAEGEGGDIMIHGSMTNKAKVTVTGTEGAIGLDAEDIVIGTVMFQEGVIEPTMIGGDMAGTITVTNNGGYEAYGMRASDNIFIGGNLSGTVTVKSDFVAIGLSGGDDFHGDVLGAPAAPSSEEDGSIYIGGDLSGKITVTAPGYACGLHANDRDVTMNNLSGTLTVTGGEMGATGIYAEDNIRINNLSGKVNVHGTRSTTGLYADDGLFLDGNLSGSVIAVSTGGDATGLYAEDWRLDIDGDVSGTVSASGVGYTGGLVADQGTLDIEGNLSGSVSATSSQSDAWGLYGDNGIQIGKNLSGKVAATANGGRAHGLQSDGEIEIDGALSGAISVKGIEAYGLEADGNVSIAGGITGSITATAKYGVHGIHAGGRIDDGYGGPLRITGSIKVSGDAYEGDTDNVKAIVAHGGMNLWISGTVSATSKTGEAYAIRSLGMADDIVELTTGAKITGWIDLGNEPEGAPPAPAYAVNGYHGGDVLILSGHGSYDAKGVAIQGIENLIVVADNTGWQLGGLNSNGRFNNIELNQGVFGFGTRELVSVTTDHFYQGSANTLLIKFNGSDCDNIYAGTAEVYGNVKFVPFGGYSGTNTYEWLRIAGPAPAMAPAPAPSALFDCDVTSTSYADGATGYNVTLERRSLAAMAPQGQTRMAALLDNAFDNGQADTLMTALAPIGDTEELFQTIDGLDQPITAPTYIVLSGSQKFSAGVASHLELVRDGMRMASRPVNSRLPSLAATGDAAIGEVLQAARAAVSETTEWQVSGRYLNDTGRLNSDGSAAGHQWKSNGFMLNVDRQMNDNLLIGAAAGGTWSYIDVRRDTGDAETTSLNTRLYAAWFDGPWHVDAQVGYGYNWNESKRRLANLGETAKGKWNSDVYTAYLGGGYDLELGNSWVLEPNAAIDYTRINDEGYDETGSSANLSVDSQSFDSLRSQLGVALRTGFKLNDSMTLRPEARLTWAHEYLDTRVHSSANFQFGGSFTSNGTRQDRDSAIIGLGLNLQFNEAVGGYVSYDAELSNNERSQGVSVGIRFNF